MRNIAIKSRDPSLKLEGLIYAQNRLSPGHPILPVLAAKQGAVEAGIGGEERVAEIFRKHSFPFEHRIFHDLSPSSYEKFQMDTHVLTPWYGLILEVKNIGGVLDFKDNPPQLIRTREDGHKDGYESPVVQLERNRELLTNFFRSRNIQLPIYSAVVLAYPKQIVAASPAKTKLLFPSLISPYLNSLPRPAKKLDKETFAWLSDELLKSHQIFIPKPICETYTIPFSDVKPGVRCITCGRIGMIKLPRTWHCRYCKASDHLAHERALREWFLIYKRNITNRECREFLKIDDVQVAKRILQSMNWQFQGTFRNRTYIIDLDSVKTRQEIPRFRQ